MGYGDFTPMGDVLKGQGPIRRLLQTLSCPGGVCRPTRKQRRQAKQIQKQKNRYNK